MTGYEFEIAAKNAVANVLSISPQELDVISLDDVLGYKKCLLHSDSPSWKSTYYIEAIWNVREDSMYVNVYNKLSSTVFTPKDLEFEIE